MTQFSREDDRGTKRITSAGDVIYEADSDQDGAGDHVFRTGGVERARIDHAGVGTGWANVLGGSVPVAVTTQTALVAALAAGEAAAVAPGTTLTLSSTVTLPNDCEVYVLPGGSIKWTGSAGGTMFQGSGANPLMRAIVTGGGKIDPNGSAGTVFKLQSPQFCRIGGFEVAAATATTTLFDIDCSATSGTGGYGSLVNAMWNHISDIHLPDTIGTVVSLSGGAAGAGVATLNVFDRVHASAVNVKFIRVVQWADNNRFGSMYCNLTASNAIGLILNDSATPAAETGVYSTFFDSLAIDTFAGGETGRQAVVLNYSRQTLIDHLFQSPVAEGGVVVDNNSQSHMIRGFTVNAADSSTNVIEIFQKNVQHVNSTIWGRSASSSTTPTLTLENTASSGASLMQVKGKDSGGTLVTGLMTTSGASVLLGTGTNHPVILTVASSEIARLTSTGITMADGKNIGLGTTTGTQIGTGTSQKVAFYGSTPVAKQTVTGSKGANAALTSLMTALAALGLVVDSTT